MKRNGLRRISFLLAILTLLTVFSACSDLDRAAIRYEDVEVSGKVFQYLCCLKKTDYLYEAYGVTSSQLPSSQLQDNPVIWTTKDATGTTMGDNLKMEVLEELQMLLYFANYAKSQGYTLTKEQVKMIEDDLNSQLYAQFDDKKQFNEKMKTYGIDYDGMLEYYKLQTLAFQGSQLLFGEEGPQRVSEDAAKKHFAASYVSFSIIFINTKNKTYPNGKVVLLPEEERGEKLNLAETVQTRLTQGESFAKVCAEVSDAKVTEEEAEKGATIAKGSHSVGAVNDKLQSLSVGEFARVNTDEGVYFVKKLALDESYFESEKETITAQLENLKKADLLAQSLEKFKLNEDFINELNITDLPFLV